MQILIDDILRELTKGNFSEVIKYCNELIASFPDNYILYEIRGNCLLETGVYFEAVNNFREAINKIDRSDSKLPDDLAQLYNRKGFAEIKLGEYKSAIEDFKSAEKYKPEFPELLNNFANAYRKMGEYQLAIDYCNKAIAVKPDFPEIYNNRGNIFYMISEDAESISDYSKAIELKPDYAGAFFNRGTAYYYLKNDLLKAKSDWEKAIELNPEYKRDLTDKLEEIEISLSNLVKAEEKTVTPEIQVEKNEFSDIMPESKNEEVEKTIPAEPVPADSIPVEHILTDHVPVDSIPVEHILTEHVPFETVPEQKFSTESAQEEIQKDISEEDTINIEKILEDIKLPEIDMQDEMKAPENFQPEEIKSPEFSQPEEIKTPEVSQPEEINKVELPEIHSFSEQKFSEAFEEKSDVLKDMDDYFKSMDTPKVENDIEIPDFNFKNIFAENKEEEYQTEEIDNAGIKLPEENIIPEELRQLHNEISEIPNIKTERNITAAEEVPEMNKEYSVATREKIPIVKKQSEFVPQEKIPLVKKEKDFAPLIKDEVLTESGNGKKRLLPILLTLIFVFIFITAGAIIIYQKFGINNENVVTNTDTTKNSTSQVEKNVTEQTKTDDSKKQEIEQQTTAKKETTTTTKVTTSAIEGRSDLILIYEGNKYYIQAGSFKDREAADTKSKQLSEKGIKSEIKEFDLKEKGIYFRVRVGTFDTPEAAKDYAKKM